MNNLFYFSILCLFMFNMDAAYAQRNIRFEVGIGALNSELMGYIGRAGGSIDNNGMIYFSQLNLENVIPNMDASVNVFTNYYKGSSSGAIPHFQTYKFTIRQYGGLVGLGYRWFNRPLFSLGSSIEVGVQYRNKKYENQIEYNETKFVYQFNVLKVRYGRKFGINAHLGYGIKGIIGLGVDYRF